MRIRPFNFVVAILTSAALGQFLVLFYNHWFFAGTYWPRWLALSLVLLPVYIGLLRSRWEKIWLGLGIYWTLLVAGFMAGNGTYDLSRIGFTSVLNLEAPMVWLPTALVIPLAAYEQLVRERALLSARQPELRALQLRRRLRRRLGRGIAVGAGAGTLTLPLELDGETGEAVMPELIEFSDGVDDDE